MTFLGRISERALQSLIIGMRADFLGHLNKALRLLKIVGLGLRFSLHGPTIQRSTSASANLGSVAILWMQGGETSTGIFYVALLWKDPLTVALPQTLKHAFWLWRNGCGVWPSTLRRGEAVQRCNSSGSLAMLAAMQPANRPGADQLDDVAARLSCSRQATWVRCHPLSVPVHRHLSQRT